MAAAAALLAITGFWVSIAADVRRRRGETALLAALGVTRREAAVQLCLEKLLLSLPSAVLGVLLGTLVAWLLVPAVTLTPAAQLPTPPVITEHVLPQAIAFALAVAVLPAVAAALAGARRPTPPPNFAPRKRRDMGGGKGMSVLRRVTGMGSAGSLALALLAGVCVLAATLGPREAPATGARALQQTMTALPLPDKTIVVASSWGDVNGDMDPSLSTGPPVNTFSGREHGPAGATNPITQFRSDFGVGPLRAKPAIDGLAGHEPRPVRRDHGAAQPQGLPARLEVTYRYPLASHLRLVAGSMPDTAPVPKWTGTQILYDLKVVVTGKPPRRSRCGPALTCP